MPQQPIRVGIIGLTPERSWASMAHVPALQSLPQYKITAVANSRQESADAAAKHYAIPHAFGDAAALASSPEVDVVAVTVKVPHHYTLVKAALEAGKHVYCEWPLGNGLAEAEELAAIARQKGVTAAVGLQARSAPSIRYVADLIKQGYAGEILSMSLIGVGMAWGAVIDSANAYSVDRKNGARLLTIPVSHTMDAVCQMFGELSEVSATIANRRTESLNVETGQTIPLTSEDQVAFTGKLQSGPVISLHYRGGMTKATGLLWEINGTTGDIRLNAFAGHAQMFDLQLSGVTGDQPEMQALTVPDSYYSTPLRQGPAVNVAEAYVRLANDLREGTSTCPSFDDAVTRHRMVDMIERAAASGQRQTR